MSDIRKHITPEAAEALREFCRKVRETTAKMFDRSESVSVTVACDAVRLSCMGGEEVGRKYVDGLSSGAKATLMRYGAQCMADEALRRYDAEGQTEASAEKQAE